MRFFAAFAGAGRHHDPRRQVTKHAIPRPTHILPRIDVPSVHQTMVKLRKVVLSTRVRRLSIALLASPPPTLSSRPSRGRPLRAPQQRGVKSALNFLSAGSTLLSSL